MSLEQALQDNTAALNEHTAVLIQLIAHAKPKAPAPEQPKADPKGTAKQGKGAPGNPANPEAADVKKLRDECGKAVLKLVKDLGARDAAVEAIKKYGGSKVSEIADDKIPGLHSLLHKRVKEAEAAAAAPAATEDDDLTGGVDDLDDLDGGDADDDLSDLDV